MEQTQPTGNVLNKVLVLLLFTAFSAVVAGCGKGPRNVLFNTPRELQRMDLPVVHLNPRTDSLGGDDYQHRLRPDDKIAVRFFNNFDITAGVTITKGGESETGITFLVDREGFVDMPMVGRVNIAGLTKQEARKKIEKKYASIFKDPSMEVTILGLSVSVQGEVERPGIFKLEREKTTLLEVLASAGGITQFGKQQVVKVIRGTAQDRDPEVLIFDLRQLDAIRTRDLILQDKDVIYVEPRDIRVVANAINPYSTFLSLLSTITTITFVTLSVTGN